MCPPFRPFSRRSRTQHAQAGDEAAAAPTVLSDGDRQAAPAAAPADAAVVGEDSHGAAPAGGVVVGNAGVAAQGETVVGPGEAPASEGESVERPGGSVTRGVGASDADAAETGEEWLAYELHEWSLESRVMLQQLLTVDQVPHSWQGTTLMVHESVEAHVDSLLDEAEEAEAAREATARPIGPDDDLTAFEVGDWSVEMRAELVERLVQARVPHILERSTGGYGEDDAGADIGAEDGAPASHHLDSGAAGASRDGGVQVSTGAEGAATAGHDIDSGAAGVDGDAAADDGSGERRDVGVAGETDSAVDRGSIYGMAQAADADTPGSDSGEGSAVEGGGWDLWVRESDEERVDLIVDDLLAQIEEADFVELDGLAVNQLLSELFVACDRLARDPRNPDGVTGVTFAVRRISEVRTPFGYSSTDWRNLRHAAGGLLAFVEADESDEDELRAMASQLAERLRMLI